MPKSRKSARADDRKIMNAIFYVLRTGMPWRDLPERYGPYTTAYNRFNRWSRRGIWKRIFDTLAHRDRATDGLRKSGRDSHSRDKYNSDGQISKHKRIVMPGKKKMILSAALMHGLGHQPGAWRVRQGPSTDYVSPDMYAAIARKAEEGKLHVLFLAEQITNLEVGAQRPCGAMDTAAVLSYMAASRAGSDSSELLRRPTISHMISPGALPRWIIFRRAGWVGMR